jgi:hypothetical protein
MESLVKAMSGAKIKIIVLDACRNNPWSRDLKQATRSVNRGFTALTPANSLVIYSAAPGEEATDGDIGQKNSPFAIAFAQDILIVGNSIQNLGLQVRDDVLKATNQGQNPFVSPNITATPYYLCPQICTGRVQTRGMPLAEAAAVQSDQTRSAFGYVLKICRTFYRAPVATYRASVNWGTETRQGTGTKIVLAVKDNSVENLSGTPIFWVQASYQGFRGKGSESIEFNISDGPLYPFEYGVYQVTEMAFRTYRDDCRQNSSRCFVTGYGEGPNLLTNVVKLKSAEEVPDCQSLRQ